MKDLLKGLVLISGLTTFSNANLLLQNNNIDDEFARMQQYMNSIMNSHIMNTPLSSMRMIDYPKVNLQEKDDKYIIEFELAGMDKKDIKLSLKDSVLILEGETKKSKDEKSKDYIRKEIYSGKFKRVIKLPNNIQSDKVDSKFENGVLTVTIPKKEKTKSDVKILKIN